MFGVSPLVPAYGRDYKSKAEVRKDWDANKDFMTPNRQYTSKQELKKMYPDLKEITIRYKKVTQSAEFSLA